MSVMRPIARHCWRLCLVLVGVWMGGGAARTDAQESRIHVISPKVFGFESSSSDVRYPDAVENFLVRYVNGKEVVAKLHVEVADTRILMMPDGTLQERDFAMTQPTDRRFISMSE